LRAKESELNNEFEKLKDGLDIISLIEKSELLRVIYRD